MANNEALFSAFSGLTYRLSSDIAAIQASFARDGRVELGAISHLPAGAELTFCGEGFNESTFKVRCEGQSYFVFMEDFAYPPTVEPGASTLTNDMPRRRNQSQRLNRFATAHVA